MSGTLYRTPVLPRIASGHVYVALPYGGGVNWARNVRASGHCRLQLRGTVYELDEPTTVTAGEHEGLPQRFRPWLVARGNRYLRLKILSQAPGTLDAAPAGEAFEGEPAQTPAPT